MILILIPAMLVLYLAYDRIAGREDVAGMALPTNVILFDARYPFQLEGELKEAFLNDMSRSRYVDFSETYKHRHMFHAWVRFRHFQADNLLPTLLGLNSRQFVFSEWENVMALSERDDAEHGFVKWHLVTNSQFMAMVDESPELRLAFDRMPRPIPSPSEYPARATIDLPPGKSGTERLSDGTLRLTLPGGATMDFAWVEPGTFQMGNGDGHSWHWNADPHSVTLTRGYWMGKTEVTQAQWKSVMGTNPSKFPGDDLPVENVSWFDCREFIRRVNASNPGLAVDLPTEAEWEFAARGGTNSAAMPFSGGYKLGDVAWYDENSGRRTHPVGGKKPNGLGLYDMSGNVGEWCADWYDEQLEGPAIDPVGMTPGWTRVFRGGSWFFLDTFCFVSSRNGFGPAGRSPSLGFRLSAGPMAAETDAAAEREAERVANRAAYRAALKTKTVMLPGDVPMDFAWVEPGTFQMGSPEDESGHEEDEVLHQVTLTRGYWMGKTEVTQEQWKSVMGENPSMLIGDHLPVDSVSWEDCQEFIRKMNELDLGVSVSLPTEAEWEFAARGGNGGNNMLYSGGDRCEIVAWHIKNSYKASNSVGQLDPNELGFWDMSGNGSEWCLDWYGPYPTGPVTDPIGAAAGVCRVVRGGHWHSPTEDCRVANRDGAKPNERTDYRCFRLLAR